MHTNNVLAFDPMRRSDAEFERTGTTPWLKALDDAEAIALAILAGQRDGTAERLASLEGRLAALHWRDDDLDSQINLALSASLSLTVTLREAPHILRMMAQAA